MCKKILLSTLLIILFIVNANAGTPKNIIIMIGDGMGYNQIQAANTVNGNFLHMQRCPYTGMSKTSSFNKYTTDSAAGGTAISCGIKTNNYMLGMSPDTVAVPSMMALARDKGMATGIVVTCNLTHATPASFYSHVIDRGMSEEIALQLFDEPVDVLIGGGRVDFEERKKDNRNVTQELQKEFGYQVAYTLEDALNIKEGRLLALLADHNLPPITAEGSKVDEDDLDHITEDAIVRGDMLPLSVEHALNLLSQNNEKGFLLMVEGSQIDFAGHAKNPDYIIGETLDFDAAIGKAIDFAERDGETLVIITADHETGGLAIDEGNYDNKNVIVRFTTHRHTASPVPVFAFGPGAEKFSGWYENIEILARINELWKARESK